MINSIITGISIAIFNKFGKEYEIFDDEIKQGLNEPCFFIACLNPTHKLFRGKRYFRTNNFCIQYFPKTDTKQRECLDVAEKMIECLDIVTVNDVQIRGTKMKYKVIDGVLHFFVNYDCLVYKVTDETPIEDMSVTQNVE